MTWEVSPILVPLIAEIKAEHPGVVIYTIGDQQHQQEVSDHNPDEWDFVCAADVMIGPHFTAADAEHLFVRLRQIKDSRTAYAIYNRRIESRTVKPWQVRKYKGDDPHTGHVHVSVVHGPDPHPTTSWHIYQEETDMDLTPANIDAIATAVAAKVWAAQGGPATARETAFERLGHIDSAVDEINAKLDALAPPAQG